MDARLVMFKPDRKRVDIQLVKPITVIGRAEDCDLELPLTGISRHHCRIRLVGGKIRLTDLSSSNGTYVNGERTDEADLSAGDMLAVGSVSFTVQIDGVPKKIAPAKPPSRKDSGPQAGSGGKRDKAKTETPDEADALSAMAHDTEEHDKEDESIAALRHLAALSGKKRKHTK